LAYGNQYHMDEATNHVTKNLGKLHFERYRYKKNIFFLSYIKMFDQVSQDFIKNIISITNSNEFQKRHNKFKYSPSKKTLQ
jgi:hypothetical protein